MRVFRINIESWLEYAGRVRIITWVEAPEVIDTMLSHRAARQTGAAHRTGALPLGSDWLDHAPWHSRCVS